MKNFIFRFTYLNPVTKKIDTHFVSAPTLDIAREGLANHLNTDIENVRHNNTNLSYNVRKRVMEENNITLTINSNSVSKQLNTRKQTNTQSNVPDYVLKSTRKQHNTSDTQTDTNTSSNTPSNTQQSNTVVTAKNDIVKGVRLNTNHDKTVYHRITNIINFNIPDGVTYEQYKNDTRKLMYEHKLFDAYYNDVLTNEEMLDTIEAQELMKQNISI